MHDQNADAGPELSWAELLRFVSPGGHQEIVDFIVDVRERRGADWLPTLEADFPMASWLVRLVCTKDADAALDEIAELYPNLPIRYAAGNQIKALHGRLKYEIERKRI